MIRLNKTTNSAAIKLDGARVTEPTDTFAADEVGDVSPYSLTAFDGPLQDAADFNVGFNWEASTGLQPHIADFIGDEIRDNIVLPHGANVPGTVRWQLDSGLAQDVSDGIITYGFFDGKHAVGLNNHPGFGEGKGYAPFTEAQKAAARIAIRNWDDLITATFVETAPGPGVKNWAQRTTDIWLANTTTGPAQAWAYFPGYGNQYQRVAGDVWIADPRVNGTNAQLDPGFYGLQTLNHELGHSLGLGHPGNYNFGDDQDNDGVPDPITYEGDAFYFQDSHQFTIMSYFDSFETGAQNVDWNVMRLVYPSTPMVDDVYVIQQKYGADMTTRVGNTTYGFSSTSDVTNAAMKFNNGEMFTVFTIWDAAGNDTIDLSGYYTPSVIDLREGAYSSAGGWGAYDPLLLGVTPTLAEINANNTDAGLGPRTARLFEIYFNGDWTDPGQTAPVNEGLSWFEITGTGSQYLMEQNIGIAYGAIIENAIGGHGNDRINGNQVDNVLEGRGGADTFIFANDGSVDTITDFLSGTDRIDLSEIEGLTVADVAYVGAQLRIDTDGDLVHDMTINSVGAINVATDIFFG